jgi:hypothetical protein
VGLIINQTYARIGIETSPASMKMQTRNAKLEIHQKQPKVNIRTELPKVEIDQYECFASSGLKGPLELTRDEARRGYESAMEYISKVANDGDTLAAIENGGNPIVDIAVRDSFTEHEFNMVTMPAVGPKITVKGSLEIDPERTSEGALNGVEYKYTPGSINFDFTPAQVRIYMAQYASINIRYEESKIDAYV